MDFTLSKQHEMVRKLFKDFAENEVKPMAQEVDETEQFPLENVQKMGKLGFLGIPVPKEYGGQGADILSYIMCVEELSKVCATTGVVVSAHTSLCADPILTYGTEEQKQKYLVPLAKGEKIGAFGLTEPGAGTDAQGVQTKAVLDGDEWVLNGSKCFITNGKYADFYIIIAYTDIVEDRRGRKVKKFSAFIVEKGTPGFTFGTKEKKMGIRGSATYELIFQDCRISLRRTFSDLEEKVSLSLCIHWMVDVLVSLLRLLVLQRVHLERTIRVYKRKKAVWTCYFCSANTQFQLANMATKV